MVALGSVIARHFINLKDVSPQLRVLVFPTLWTTVWLGISWISPVGRLVTWSPLTGISSYQWIRAYFGFAGIDWITAAWASIAGEILGFFLEQHEMEEPLLVMDDERPVSSQRTMDSSRVVPWTGLLLALAVPSFFLNSLPLPPFSSSTTSLKVACILPKPSEESQLKRFLGDTQKFASLAKVLLWPESAIVFESQSEKDKALEEVQLIATNSKVWIGVSFEERIQYTGVGRDGLYRNGLTLVGPEGIEMSYYKRKLVPIAESFSQIPSHDDPPIHTINYPSPHWSKTREIPLSSSICLDFSAPLTALPSRPALILAPAKTWHVGVGLAMYELARARGEEIGAEVLWCDGGAGGLSGVAGNLQVGTESWAKTIGVPFPIDDRRTLYGACGDWLVVALLLGMPGFAWVVRWSELAGIVGYKRGVALSWMRQRAQAFVGRIRRREEQGPSTSVQNERLIDDT
ncbi:hypothetical protein K439DRAFT_1621342 [Ramaria rubella]|nr:hypothetical protein K439DRAFT_1621342 [Ramaria rubella]